MRCQAGPSRLDLPHLITSLLFVLSGARFPGIGVLPGFPLEQESLPRPQAWDSGYPQSWVERGRELGLSWPRWVVRNPQCVCMSWEVWAELATCFWASTPHWSWGALGPWWPSHSDGSLSLQVGAELLLESQVRQGLGPLHTPGRVGRPMGGQPGRDSCPGRSWSTPPAPGLGPASAQSGVCHRPVSLPPNPCLAA